MTDTMTREERINALDEFATAAMPTGTDIATITAAPPPEVVYGSREVATPRDEQRILSKIRTLAAAAGSDWYYRYPVKNRKKGTTEWIEGESINLALDIARIYGNCHVDCRAQDFGSVILFHARFHDIESGFSLTRPFQQRKGAAKIGGSDEARREDMDFQIGASKSIRNVITDALRTFSKFAFEEARFAIVDKIGKNIERWRADTLDHLKVDVLRVEAVIGRPAKDWLAPDIARVRAMGTAIEQGMATWDESFPPLGKGQDSHDPDTGEVLDAFAADERTMVNSGGAASGVASAGSEQTAAAAAPPPLADAAAAVDDRPEIIDKLMQLAAEKVPAQDRLETLDVSQTGLLDRYPDSKDFVKTAVATAAKVIKGELPAAAARKYLASLVTGD